VKRFAYAGVVFLVTIAAIVSRGPDRLFRAQFWADDASFYSLAYQYGARTLVQPYSGYLNTLQRLVALSAQVLPLARAPLLFSVVGILIETLPVPFLLSERCRNIGGFGARAALALAYVALPGTLSLDANVAFGQWHLAVLAFLIVMALPPPGRAWKAFDVTALIATALSSVFGVLLLPFALLRRRYFWLLSCTAIVQAVAVLTSGQLSKRHPPLHASLRLLSEILANHIFVGSLLGPTPWFFSAASYAVCGAGFALVAYAALKGVSELRLFLSFAALTLAVSLASPGSIDTDWPRFATQAVGGRYWFIPGLAFVVTLMSLLFRGRRPVRVAAGSLLAVGVLALPWTWRYPPLPDHHFPELARRYDKLPRGAEAVFPICPEPAVLRLTKR